MSYIWPTLAGSGAKRARSALNAASSHGFAHEQRHLLPWRGWPPKNSRRKTPVPFASPPLDAVAGFPLSPSLCHCRTERKRIAYAVDLRAHVQFRPDRDIPADPQFDVYCALVWRCVSSSTSISLFPIPPRRTSGSRLRRFQSRRFPTRRSANSMRHRLVLHLPPLCLGRRFSAVAAPGGLRASAFSGLLPQDELGSPSRKCSPCLGSSAPRALRDLRPETTGQKKRRPKSSCTPIAFH